MLTSVSRKQMNLDMIKPNSFKRDYKLTSCWYLNFLVWVELNIQKRKICWALPEAAAKWRGVVGCSSREQAVAATVVSRSSGKGLWGAIAISSTHTLDSGLQGDYKYTHSS